MREFLVTADDVVLPSGERHEAFVVRDRRIASYGSLEDLRALGLPEERFVGGVITAGLRDAHFHPVTYASAISGISLKTATDINDVNDRLRHGAQSLPAEEPLVAIRLDDEFLADGRLPTRHDLDKVSSERPILIHRYCGHVAVANTSALVLAGVSRDTPDPEGGVIDRDDHGEPTGVLRETAITAVSTKLQRSITVTPERLVRAMGGLASLGLTSIGAMIGCGDGPWASLGDEVAILAEAARSIPIKINVFVIANTAEQLEASANTLRNAGRNIEFRGLKRFADGSLGGHTAAMRSGFSDRPRETGTMRLTATDTRLAEAAVGMGARVAIHAIGDRAVGATLDVCDGLIAGGADASRLRIEHVSVVDDGDVRRFGESGITASVQPAFIGSETTWLEKRVGTDRLERTYAFRSLLDAGTPLAGGSDCPVEPPHPLIGMALARDRAGIVPGQGVSALEGLQMFTSSAATACGEEEPMAVGAPADFVVLDRDPLRSTPDELRSAAVLATFVDGELVPVPDGFIAWNE